MRSLPALVLGASLWLAPSAALGQMALATNQGLTFGTLVPGASAVVSAQTSVANRGELVLSGSGRASVSFTLPTGGLKNQDGVVMTVTFGPTDGQVSQRNGGFSFDPSLGTSVKLLGAQNTATIWLGGTVVTAPTQPAGTYQGTIVVNVVPQ